MSTTRKVRLHKPRTNGRREAAPKPEHGVRHFTVGEGLPDLTHARAELQDMTDVLLGRVDPPIDKGTLTLMEVADAFFARASEMTMLIQQGEREGTVGKGSGHYKFRTGELRTFLDMAKRASDLGSRRLTHEQVMMQMRQDMDMLGYDD